MITLMPSDAGDNNESSGIKKSFWPKIGVTIYIYSCTRRQRYFRERFEIQISDLPLKDLKFAEKCRFEIWVNNVNLFLERSEIWLWDLPITETDSWNNRKCYSEAVITQETVTTDGPSTNPVAITLKLPSLSTCLMVLRQCRRSDTTALNVACPSLIDFRTAASASSLRPGTRCIVTWQSTELHQSADCQIVQFKQWRTKHVVGGP